MKTAVPFPRSGFTAAGGKSSKTRSAIFLAALAAIGLAVNPGCTKRSSDAKAMPPTDNARKYLEFCGLKEIDAIRHSSRPNRPRKEVAELLYVDPVQKAGYNFDRTVSEYCRLARADDPKGATWIAFATAPSFPPGLAPSVPPQTRAWVNAVSMLSIWNGHRSVLAANGFISAPTATLFSSKPVQAEIRRFIHGTSNRPGDGSQ